MTLTRYGVEAPDLPKRRRPSRLEKDPEYTAAEVDEYNTRQTMRCVETRNRWQPTSDDGSVGTPGMRRATTVQRVEIAQRNLPSIELAAYMAKEQGTQEHQNQLVDEVEKYVRKLAGMHHWRYHQRVGRPDPLRMLASIVVEEWLTPQKYWKLYKDEDGTPRVKPITSAFMKVMGCKRDTWVDYWHARYIVLQGYPQGWYEIGKARVDSGL